MTDKEKLVIIARLCQAEMRRNMKSTVEDIKHAKMSDDWGEDISREFKGRLSRLIKLNEKLTKFISEVRR